MKKTIVNKIVVLTLAVMAVFLQNVPSAFAADEEINPGVEYSDVIPDEIHVGDIIDLDSEKSIVIEVNEDGSFKTMKLSENVSVLSNCNHYKLIQVGNPAYKGRKRVNSTTVCYYNVYLTKYKCANKRCSAIRYTYTYIPVQHTFKNGKCTVCNRKKKQGTFYE